MPNETPVAAQGAAASPVAPDLPTSPSEAATTTGRSGPAASSSCRRPISGAPSGLSSGLPCANEPTSPAYPKPGPRARRWTGAPSANETALYGDLLTDVVLLRQRGFGVHREGELFRVGNRLMDGAALQAVAARERRLLVPLSPTPFTT